MLLTERKADTLLRRRSVVGSGRSPIPASFSDPSDPPPLFLSGPLQHMEIPPARRTMAPDFQIEFDGDGDDDDNGIISDDDLFPVLASARKAEAAAFLGDNEEYYSRAGSMRRRGSISSRTAHAGTKHPTRATRSSCGRTPPPVSPCHTRISSGACI